MKCIKIYLKNNSYKVQNYGDRKLSSIAGFLIHDVLSDTNYWIKKITDPNCPGTGGDWISIDRENDGYLYMWDVILDMDYKNYPPQEAMLKIKPLELAKIINGWRELYQNGVKEIMITQDGETFEIFEVKE